VTTGAEAASDFRDNDDNDRVRALQRLDAIDHLGCQRLLDALWPAEDPRRRSIRMPHDHEFEEPR
jgi:hypothetical protein